VHLTVTLPRNVPSPWPSRTSQVPAFHTRKHSHSDLRYGNLTRAVEVEVHPTKVCPCGGSCNRTSHTLTARRGPSSPRTPPFPRQNVDVNFGTAVSITCMPFPTEVPLWPQAKLYVSCFLYRRVSAPACLNHNHLRPRYSHQFLPLSVKSGRSVGGLV